MSRSRSFLSLLLSAFAWSSTAAHAQSLGSFSWQLQPYCNVVTVNVTGVAGVYTVEGYDDQCGAPTRAPLTGVATPNPDGTIGFGLNVVTTPGGRGVQVDARIALANLSGPWTDSDGHQGTFAFDQKTGGSPRPTPAPMSPVPPAFALRLDGAFAASGTFGQGQTPLLGGTGMLWFPGKAAFRAGQTRAAAWSDNLLGEASAAFGRNTTAREIGGFAAGVDTTAKAYGAAFGLGTYADVGGAAFGDQAYAGRYSLAVGAAARAADTGAAIGTNALTSAPDALALGAGAKARGLESVATTGSTADGSHSIAMGSAWAQGTNSIAIGNNVVAVAGDSVVLGSYASTLPTAVGSFVFGDTSSANVLQAVNRNSFTARAAGGYVLYSSAGMTSGVQMPAGTSAWSTLSDVNSKEHFRDVDGTDVLRKIATMRIPEWNYKTQDAAIRHIGPMAQDFHAAFGLGEDPLRISTIDADGIALRAIQALELRTREEHAALRLENDELRAAVVALRARIDTLETTKR